MANYPFFYSITIVKLHKVWKTVLMLRIFYQYTYYENYTKEPYYLDRSLILEY